ncbi:MAG TPA: hypothetical protein VLU99_03865 [Nitrososphaerales archaeon]|nr:hypothetical protein [Nitrososphaerales archaeon]HUK74906.1 hypothetical protein [Nitrososphaerales archaeon]
MIPDPGAVHSALTSLVFEADEGFETEEVLDLAIAVFALVLLALTLSAYRRTRLRRLLVVSAAFGLFAIEVGIRQLDAFVFTVGVQTDQILVGAMEFVILVLFFVAVVIRD